MKRHIQKLSPLILLLVVSSYSVPAQLPSVGAAPQPELPPNVDFSFRPRFIIIGEIVNFTSIVSGGSGNYTSFSWDFDDSQTGSGRWVLHSFTSPRTYLVSLNVTDSNNERREATKSVVVHEWPISRYGWNIKWNITLPSRPGGYTDGINVWDVTYQGVTVIRDARIPHVVVTYRPGLCPRFYDQPLAVGPIYSMQNTKNSGMIYYEESAVSPDPYFQLRAKYDVGGYNYTQVFRFYSSGRWEPELLIGRSGCTGDHTYEPQIRVDLAVVDDGNDFASVYTPLGAWQNLLWEGAYTDNGFRDQTHNGSQWRIGDQRRYYYIVPNVLRMDTDIQQLPSRILLVRTRSNEIETSGCNISSCGSALQYVDGEMAFRRDITIWWIPFLWSHGQDSTRPLSNQVVALSFFPHSD